MVGPILWFSLRAGCVPLCWPLRGVQMGYGLMWLFSKPPFYSRSSKFQCDWLTSTTLFLPSAFRSICLNLKSRTRITWSTSGCNKRWRFANMVWKPPNAKSCDSTKPKVWEYTIENDRFWFLLYNAIAMLTFPVHTLLPFLLLLISFTSSPLLKS